MVSPVIAGAGPWVNQLCTRPLLVVVANEPIRTVTTSRSGRRESIRPLFVVVARDVTVCPAAPTTQLLPLLS